jgi:predicted Ser/Thr protein kinase
MLRNSLLDYQITRTQTTTTSTMKINSHAFLVASLTVVLAIISTSDAAPGLFNFRGRNKNVETLVAENKVLDNTNAPARTGNLRQNINNDSDDDEEEPKDVGLQPDEIVYIEDKSYRVERELGRGVQAVAYLAYDENEEPVVIKRSRGPPYRRIDSIELEIRALEEARMLIGKSQQSSPVGPIYYIVMKYYEGDVVGDLILEEDDKGKIAGLKDDYVRGLARFHEESRVLHNDGHPGNGIRLKDGRIQFIDLGKSQVLSKYTPKEQKEYRQSDIFWASLRFDQEVERAKRIRAKKLQEQQQSNN